MGRRSKQLATVTLILLTVLSSLWFTLPHWLPTLLRLWLPSSMQLVIAERPLWRDGSLLLEQLSLQVGECKLVEIEGATLGYQQHQWHVNAQKVTTDSRCFAEFPSTSASQTYPAVALSVIQAALPSFTLSFSQFELLPWQELGGELQLSSHEGIQQISLKGDSVTLRADLQANHLSLHELALPLPGISEPVKLQGEIELGDNIDAVPRQGRLNSVLVLPSPVEQVSADLTWQQQRGTLTVTYQQHRTPLLNLPWQADNDALMIEKGEWHWPFYSQKLSGGVSLTLSHWSKGLDETQLNGRVNLLTEGRGGKGNLVLSFGPGMPMQNDKAFPLNLYGDGKAQALQFFARLPGEIRGGILSPAVYFKPGALLRMKGRLLSLLDVDEARWPLAGVSVSASGIDGRLQAILRAHENETGAFRLHLDGRAEKFGGDSGSWQWRYWGEGESPRFDARWDLKGRGQWRNNTIMLESLSTGFNQLRYNGATIRSPRLKLTQPLIWQRSDSEPRLQGALQLKAEETQFVYGGYLPASLLAFTINGQSPDAFQLQGSINAGTIGPVQLRGRWDGTRLRGEAWWPEQSLTVFQPLLSKTLKMHIQSGTLRAQTAFSASAQDGFQAGGHWVVKQGKLWMPDNEVNGIDFSLPFRLKGQRWQFGAKQPVKLRIAEVRNQFRLQNLRADLQGYYPWNTHYPLQLNQLAVDLLGGHLQMPRLQLPQKEAAHIQIDQVELRELVNALKVQQITLSGKINGDFPFWVNRSKWLIEEGYITNQGPLTVRMDPDFANTLSANNIAAGIAMDWLRNMRIDESRATLALDNIGMMTLTAKVIGTSRFSDKNQHVSLNYRQQENIFQLWRSLRFGDNLQSWVEQNSSLPVREGEVR
ncbi:MAG: hypothetical protein XXXJIFNMEKO3_01401 [Candidatus Erwinia impunctatus]|nr:hypothetical protein XXXJIFNMEKO_01401 [Culicoides impunctatus]